MADRAASRYVKSLLGLAIEKNVLEQVHQDMLMFAKVVDSNPSFRLLLKNPIVRHDKKRAILSQLFGGKVNPLTMSIFDILTRKNREPLLPAIASEFHNAYNEYKGIGKATITSAAPLDNDTRKQIELLVKSISAKKEIELAERTDASLIGGFILNVGDRQIDASVRSKLKSMQTELSKNPFIREI